jgi:hypothetical protein
MDLPGVRVLGDRWDFEITVADANGAVIDLTGATVTMILGSGKPKTATLADQTSEQGKATATFTPAQTAALVCPAAPGGQLRYRVSVSFDAANKDTVADGYIRVTR